MYALAQPLRGWMLAASVVAQLMVVAPAALADDPLPPPPPYCEAGPWPNGGDRTASGSTYCLRRQVDPSLVVPPEGWSPHVGTFNLVTAFFPEKGPAPVGLPVPYDYPNVVLFHDDPGSVQPRFPRWSQVSYGRNLNDPAGAWIELVPVRECTQEEPSCEFQVRPCSAAICAGSPPPGEVPAWYEVLIPEYVEGNAGAPIFLFSFAGAGIGLVPDGNHPPSASLALAQTDPENALAVEATVNASDPDGDDIVAFLYDWGDGTQTQSTGSVAQHPYATASERTVNVYVQDEHGAWTVATERVPAGYRLEATVTGAHEVPVGGRLQLGVSVKNVGDAPIDTRVVFGYAPGYSPPAGTFLFSQKPPVPMTKIDPGQSLEGTYVLDGLKAGIVPFTFGGNGRPTGCPLCRLVRHEPPHEIVIGGASKPDAIIEGKGDAVYNTTGQGQKLNVSHTPGRSRTLVLDVQNDGQAMCDVKVKGTAGTDPFVVRYFKGNEEITDAVTAGTYTVENLPVGGKQRLKMKLKVKAGAAVGTVKNMRVDFTSLGSQAKDVVKVKARVAP